MSSPPSAATGSEDTTPRGVRTVPETPAPADRYHDLDVARRIYPVRILVSIVLSVGIAMLVHMLVTNPRLQWNVVADYLFDPAILAGLGHTLELTAISMAASFAFGVVLASMRLSRSRLARSTSWTYIWFFRGTPLLVQLIFWFNIAVLVPTVSIGIPFGPAFDSVPTNQLVSPYAAAVLALSLNESAYMAEIIRSGILSVGRGQSRAATSIGMRKSQVFRWIVLPQAMRIILPPSGNQVIGMLKTTSLVSVVAYADLMYSAQLIYTRTYQVIPLLIVASIWYLVWSSLLTVIEHYVEARFSRGHRGDRRLGLMSGVLGSSSGLGRLLSGGRVPAPAPRGGRA